MTLHSQHVASLLVAGAVLLVSGAGLSSCHRGTAEDTAAGQALSVKVQTVKLQSFRDAIVAPGTVVPSPAGDLLVVAPEAGQIVELPKPEGATVQAGEVLVRFVFTGSADDVAKKQADVQEAGNKLEAAKAELAKQQSMLAKGYTAKSSVDLASAAVSAANGALTQTQALLKAATTLSERAVVKAPFAGVIAQRMHNENDFVAASPDDPVLRLVDPTRVQIAVQVSPGQLVRINPGQEATVNDLNAAGPMTAVVATRPVVADTAVNSVEIRLALTTPPATPLALQTVVQAEIVLATRSGVMAVPASAVQRAEGISFVMVAGADGLAHRHDVKVGLVTRDLAEILTGLAVGDDVIVSSLDQINENTAVLVER